MAENIATQSSDSRDKAALEDLFSSEDLAQQTPEKKVLDPSSGQQTAGEELFNQSIQQGSDRDQITGITADEDTLIAGSQDAETIDIQRSQNRQDNADDEAFRAADTDAARRSAGGDATTDNEDLPGAVNSSGPEAAITEPRQTELPDSPASSFSTMATGVAEAPRDEGATFPSGNDSRSDTDTTAETGSGESNNPQNTAPGAPDTTVDARESETNSGDDTQAAAGATQGGGPGNDRGHGNDADGVDEDNPGQGAGGQNAAASHTDEANSGDTVTAAGHGQDTGPAGVVAEAGGTESGNSDTNPETGDPEANAGGGSQAVAGTAQGAGPGNDRGHGNDADGVDEDNPGQGAGGPNAAASNTDEVSSGDTVTAAGRGQDPGNDADGVDDDNLGLGARGQASEDTAPAGAVAEAGGAESGNSEANAGSGSQAAAGTAQGAGPGNDRGHGNDADGVDEDNPGQSPRTQASEDTAPAGVVAEAGGTESGNADTNAETGDSEANAGGGSQAAAGTAQGAGPGNDRGHGNDADGVDEDNPGQGAGGPNAAASNADEVSSNDTVTASGRGQGPDNDRGHGNDADGVDEDNPGQGSGGPNATASGSTNEINSGDTVTASGRGRGPDNDRGHGNDADGVDDDNPGQGAGGPNAAKGGNGQADADSGEIVHEFDVFGGSGSISGNDSGGWTDVIQLSADGANDPDNPWTIEVNGEQVEYDLAMGGLDLDPDSAGTITTDEGTELAFDHIEKILWS